MDNIRNELGKLRNEVWNILQLDYSKRTGFIPSILGRIDGILEAPKRNCDVGTVREQDLRFDDFCNSHECDKCPLRKGSESCALGWAHMPYKKEGE